MKNFFVRLVIVIAVLALLSTVNTMQKQSNSGYATMQSPCIKKCVENCQNLDLNENFEAENNQFGSVFEGEKELVNN